jgi:hypothetical protein
MIRYPTILPSGKDLFLPDKMTISFGWQIINNFLMKISKKKNPTKVIPPTENKKLTNSSIQYSLYGV